MSESPPQVCRICGRQQDPSWDLGCPYCIAEGRLPRPAGRAVPPAGSDAPRYQQMGGADRLTEGGGVPPTGRIDTTSPGSVPGSPDETAPDTRRQADGAMTAAGRQAIAETRLDQPPAPPAKAWLLYQEEGHNKWYPVAGEVEIGRDPANQIVVPDDDLVTRFHALIRTEKDDEGHERYVLWDRGSRNGTWVNGEKISAPRPLKDKDAIRVGGMTFTFINIG